MSKLEDIKVEIAMQKIELATIRLNKDIHDLTQSIELLKEQKAKMVAAKKRIQNINPNQIQIFGTAEDIITKLISEAYEI